jgi:hypothetical protein
MRVYVNLDSNEFVVSPTLLQRVSTLFFVRRDNVPVEVQFVRSGEVVELAAGATGKMGIKAAFDGDFLAYDSAWTKTGTGTTTVYAFGLNLNTTEMDAEFATDEEESISAKVEIEWVADALTSSTLPCAATVYNDVIRGGEGSAVTSASASGIYLTSPNGTVWDVMPDNTGALSATATLNTAGPSGVAMRSPNGTSYILTVDNTGVLTLSQQ